MDKNHVRKLFLQKRRDLSSEIVEQVAKIIAAKVLTLTCYNHASSIGLYMSINNEIDLNDIFKHALEHNKKCYFPKVIDKNSMIFLPATNLNDFIKSKWGILEPITTEIESCPVSELNVLLVPLVAFDILGNRIGMGKGFYDKMLAKKHSTILVGVAYEFQKIDYIKPETWDVKLDIIVTEEKIYFV